MAKHGEVHEIGDGTPPVLGRPSPAAGSEPRLRSLGDVSSASYRAEGAGTGWCVLRGATVAGVRHRLAGRPADDSFAWGHDHGRLVVAVADGVGSVTKSAHAAERACRAAVQGALGAGGEDPGHAVEIGVAAANRAAEGGGATTVVVAVVDRTGEGAVGRVGDSTAFLIEAGLIDGGLIDKAAEGAGGAELFRAPDPDRADSSTMALPAISPDFQAAQIEMSPGAVLVLASDGVADPWRDGPTTVAPALVEGLRSRPSPVELLRLADFSRHGCHDDRTVVCVWLG